MLLWISGYVHLFKSIYFFGCIPRSGIPGAYGILFSGFFFWESFILFSTVAAPVYIPTSSEYRFLFLHILANICYLCSFWWWTLWQVWGGFLFWFWFAVPAWVLMLNLMYLLAICMSSLEKYLFISSAHFKIKLLDINPLSVISFANLFSHSVGCLLVLSMISFAVLLT